MHLEANKPSVDRRGRRVGVALLLSVLLLAALTMVAWSSSGDVEQTVAAQENLEKSEKHEGETLQVQEDESGSAKSDFFSLGPILTPLRVLQPKYTPPGGVPCITPWMAVSLAKAAYQRNGRLAERMIRGRRWGNWGGCSKCRVVSRKDASGLGGRWWAYAFVDDGDNLYVAFRGSNISPMSGGNFPGNIMMPTGNKMAYFMEIDQFNRWLAELESRYGAAYMYVGHSAGGYFALRVKSRSGKTWRVTFNAPGSESAKWVINLRTHKDQLSADTNQYIKVGPRNGKHALDDFGFMTHRRSGRWWSRVSSKLRYRGCKVQVNTCTVKAGNDVALVVHEDSTVKEIQAALGDVTPPQTTPDLLVAAAAGRGYWRRIYGPRGKRVLQTSIDGSGMVWAVFTDGSVGKAKGSRFSVVTSSPKMTYVATSNSGAIVLAVDGSGMLYKLRSDGKSWLRQRRNRFKTIGVGSGLSYGTRMDDSIVRFLTKRPSRRHCSLNGRLRQISVHGRMVVGVSSSNNMYTYKGDNKWSHMKLGQAIWMTRGNDGFMFRITKDQKIWVFMPRLWKPISKWWRQLPGRAVKIDAANAQQITVVSRSGRAFRFIEKK